MKGFFFFVSQAAKEIKERLVGFCWVFLTHFGKLPHYGVRHDFSVARVTMAPAFRLTARPAVSGGMSEFTVDFSAERSKLQQLCFLPGESVGFIFLPR